MGKLKKPPRDPRGGHSRLYWDLQDSVAWRALSATDRDIWLWLRRKLKVSNNGNIEATLSTLRLCGIRSSSTLAKSLRALQTLGFIEKTRQGGIAAGGKECSLYRFTDEQVYEHPALGIPKQSPTNDWNKFQNLAQTQATLREAHARAKRPKPSPAKIVKLRDSKRLSSQIEPESALVDSKCEQETHGSIRSSKQQETARTVVNPRLDAEFG